MTILVIREAEWSAPHDRDQLPDPKQGTMSSQSTTIAVAHGASEVAVAISLLRGAGIEVSIANMHTNLVAWHWTGALGGTQLRVKSGDAEAALELLEGFEPASSNRATPWRFVIALLVFLWAGLPPPPSGFYRLPPQSVRADAARALLDNG